MEVKHTKPDRFNLVLYFRGTNIEFKKKKKPTLYIKINIVFICSYLKYFKLMNQSFGSHSAVCSTCLFVLKKTYSEFCLCSTSHDVHVRHLLTLALISNRRNLTLTVFSKVLGKCETFVYTASDKDVFHRKLCWRILKDSQLFLGGVEMGWFFLCEITNFWIYSLLWWSLIYSRFLVVDDEANQAFVFRRSVVFPRQPDGMACCGIGLELQDVTFTCLNQRILS